jgi:hypothetical protein
MFGTFMNVFFVSSLKIGHVVIADLLDEGVLVRGAFAGSLLDPPELLEIQIGWLVCHITCGYVACVPDCRVPVRCFSQPANYYFVLITTCIAHMLKG